MTGTSDPARARRYLLGDTSDQESAVVEQDYLEHEDALERMAAAEDDLIEEYLAGQLSPSDRDRFERTYLSAPHHRVRVDTIRRLMAHAARSAPVTPRKASAPGWTSFRRTGPWLALAASILFVVSAALWRSGSTNLPRLETARTETPPAAPSAGQPAQPRVFALTISPVAVRSTGEGDRVVIPAGTDTVAIRLEREADGRDLAARRASIQTVAGSVAWQGPVAVERDLPAGAVARIDVPAGDLPADDYIVTLYGTDRAGVEREWTRYFLPVRAR